MSVTMSGMNANHMVSYKVKPIVSFLDIRVSALKHISFL